MKILKEVGSYEILTPRPFLKEQLKLIESAGRTCYWSEQADITDESAAKFCKKLVDSDHMAMVEHGSMSVRFIGISIGETREQNRHRITSLAERSTRYVDYAKGGEDLDRFQLRFVLSPDIEENEQIDLGDGVIMTPKEYLELGEKFYRGVRKAGHRPDSARQFLWLGTETQEVVTTNFREWLHIFKLRTAKPAHWEIRRTLGNLLEDVRQEVPVIFDGFKVAGVDKYGVNYYEYDRKCEKQEN